MALGGHKEYNVTLSYTENGSVRGFDTPVWALSTGLAVLSATKILRQYHPDAVVFRSVVEDKVLVELLKPKEVS